MAQYGVKGHETAERKAGDLLYFPSPKGGQLVELGYETFANNLDRLMKTTTHGVSFWHARDIQNLLGYQRWENFENVIDRARMACEASNHPPENHFRRTAEMVSIGSTAKRERGDWILSRYACYLAAMNGDPSIREIGFAQAYFAIQTRRQEVQDKLTDGEKRLLQRSRVKAANKNLASAAKKAGVRRFPVFQDAGYRGLYGGIGQADIKSFKGIPEKETLLDCIGRAELAANEFRITQTEQKLVRDNISSEAIAITTHHDVGLEVRETIRKIGGTMPENLPKEPPIKLLVAEQRKQFKAARKQLK